MNQSVSQSDACREGHKVVVGMLLLQGAGTEIIRQNNFREILLYLATKRGHEAIVELFLDNGVGYVIDTAKHASPKGRQFWARNGGPVIAG